MSRRDYLRIYSGKVFNSHIISPKKKIPFKYELLKNV
jgi:hypothetical protein